MRTESRVTGAGPHPGGSARWVGHCVFAPTPRPRPYGPPTVCLSSSWTRKLDGPVGRGTRPPSLCRTTVAGGAASLCRIAVAGGAGRPTRMGPTTRPQIRTAGSAEPHTGSRPSASSPGPATEFDLPTRAWRPRHAPSKPGTPGHGPAPVDGARTTTATKG